MDARFGSLIGTAALAATMLAGCAPPHPHVRANAPLRTIAALDCPQSQGSLTLKTAATDHRTCAYATASGEQVTLQLVDLAGKDPLEALTPIEAQLKAELPAAAASDVPEGPPAPPGAPPPPAPPGGDDRDGGAHDRDRVDIDLPGLHIHTGGDGRAKVDAGGVHVDAHDEAATGAHGRATVRIGGDDRGVRVEANDGGAQIRIREQGSGFRARFILASDKPGPHGFKVAAYEARGPEGGPLAVASVLGKSDDEDELRDDIRALLKRNVGE